MTREEKAKYIEDLTTELQETGVFYLADTSELTVEKINDFRGRCFKNGIRVQVVKNTLLAKAMDKVEDKELGELRDVLSGPTSVLYAEVGNAPAKVIKDFRKKNDKPVVKAAFVDHAIYVGDDQLDALTAIKSKEELVGDIVSLLQSPAKNVVSGLKGQGDKIAGIVKTLSERA
ncbi:MAG: 50S ribosomal protein L10 [Bacteroidota bacterium]